MKLHLMSGLHVIQTSGLFPNAPSSVRNQRQAQTFQLPPRGLHFSEEGERRLQPEYSTHQDRTVRFGGDCKLLNAPPSARILRTN